MTTYDSIAQVSTDPPSSLLTRSGAIDQYKFMAFVAVVFIHTSHALETNGLSALGFLDQISRFAVPFFFLASGYFLGLKGREGLIAFRRRAKRILLIFGVWSLFYVLLDQPSAQELLSLKYLAKWALSGGPGYHLWFLPSLLICLAVFLSLLALFSPKKVWLFALALYFFGVAFGAYRSALGLPDIRFNTHNGPFLGTLFVATGFLLATSKPRISPLLAFSVAILGLAVHLGESIMLNAFNVLPFAANEFSLGTVPFAVGVFAMALSSAEVKGRRTSVLQLLGEWSLGLYCVHVAYIWLFSKLFHQFGMVEVLILSLLVIVSSSATVLLLSHFKPFRAILR
jgi:surface polysaccharide O-acyltransferase-like enzyme